MKDKLHFRAFFNIQITCPCFMSAADMSPWEQWEIHESPKFIHLFFLCVTCTGLPSYYLIFFSLFSMTSLLKVHIGYKICSEVELSYCCGNIFFFLQQTQYPAVFHACYCYTIGTVSFHLQLDTTSWQCHISVFVKAIECFGFYITV